MYTSYVSDIRNETERHFLFRVSSLISDSFTRNIINHLRQ